MLVTVDKGTGILRFYIKLRQVCSWNGVKHVIDVFMSAMFRVSTIILEFVGCFFPYLGFIFYFIYIAFPLYSAFF